MVLPGGPFAHLVVAQANVLFGVAKTSFDEPLLPGHLGELLQWGIGGSVGKVILMSAVLGSFKEPPLLSGAPSLAAGPEAYIVAELFRAAVIIIAPHPVGLNDLWKKNASALSFLRLV